MHPETLAWARLTRCSWVGDGVGFGASTNMIQCFGHFSRFLASKPCFWTYALSSICCPGFYFLFEGWNCYKMEHLLVIHSITGGGKEHIRNRQLNGRRVSTGPSWADKLFCSVIHLFHTDCLIIQTKYFFREFIECVKIIRDSNPNHYMVLVKFRNQVRSLIMYIMVIGGSGVLLSL